MIGISSNKLADQLSTMPDQALPRMAQQYKDDAITLSMILSEKNRRDRVRQTGAAQQAQQPQAKVNDQVVASMQPLPETVGIGALPAPNMQGMAEGGIVAFGDGGDVPGYADGTLVDQIEAANRMSLNTTGFPLTAAQRARLEQSITSNIAEEAAGRKAGAAGSVFDPSAFRPAAAAPAVKPTGVAALAAPRGDVRFPAGLTGEGVLGATPAPTVDKDALAAAAPAAGSLRAPIALAKPELGYAARLKAAVGEAPDFETRRKTNIAAEKAGEETGLAKLKADQESEMASMFKGREERVGKREGALEKSKDVNTGMAFLEAGLAMMQSRGRGLAGIAEGAAVGTKQYASGIKDIRAAQEKLDDARDRMEELRQNQSSMNNKEVRAAEKGIRDIVNRGNEQQLAGAEKAYGIKREDMRTAVASDIAVAEEAKKRATQLQAANIAAAPGLERNKMLAASRDDQAKVRTEYGKLQAKVMSDLAKDPTYALATPAEKSQMSATRLREALQNNPFLSAYAAGVGFSNAPANSTVRTLDED